MLSYKDFTTTEGKTDWAALEAARVAHGESCKECRGIRLFADGPGLCSDCENLKGNNETRHRSRIRCPHCGHIQKAVGDDDYERYQDGEHTVTCYECNKDYEIETHVTYSFTSPPR